MHFLRQHYDKLSEAGRNRIFEILHLVLKRREGILPFSPMHREEAQEVAGIFKRELGINLEVWT